VTALPDRGRLAVLPLPNLLLLLRAEGFSGALRLVCDPVTCTVEMREGKPIRVRSEGAGAKLCDWLQKAGRLSAEDAAKVEAQAPRHGGSEEKTLLALRLLGPRDLCLALRAHEGELLQACFAWSDGTFELVAGAGPPADAALFAHDPLAAVHSGVSTHWSAERTLAALGRAAQRFARPNERFAEVAASLEGLPGFDGLRERLDGRLRLGEAARDADGAGALAAAFVLHSLGALEHADTAWDGPAAEAAPAAPEADAGPEIEIVVAGRDAPSDDTAASKASDHREQRSAEADAVREDLLAKHGRLKELDYYALLEIQRNADTASVRRAYMAAAKRFHPDVVARVGLGDLREVANEVFARISKAHATLADPKHRAEYDDGLEEGGLEEAQRLASAETYFRKGEVLLRMGNFEQALGFLAPAVKLCDDEPDYLISLGWALFRQSASDPEAARQHLERAAKLAPDNALAHQRLGTVLRAMGHEKEASAQLAKARQLDPNVAKQR
jgi:curved DNA-binding protein CbpA